MDITKLTSKIVYQTLLEKKSAKQKRILEEKWRGWNIFASNHLVKASDTPPNVRQFITHIRHGGLMVKDRTAHFSPTGDSMCNVCGEAKETQMHFLFECDEAVIFWAQICSIFPKMQNRNIEEMMWFKQESHFEKDEKQTDEAVAEALFLRWKERCKATMQAKYRYSSTKMWEDWAHAMKLRFQGRWHLPQKASTRCRRYHPARYGGVPYLRR